MATQSYTGAEKFPAPLVPSPMESPGPASDPHTALTAPGSAPGMPPAIPHSSGTMPDPVPEGWPERGGEAANQGPDGFTPGAFTLPPAGGNGWTATAGERDINASYVQDPKAPA